MIWAALLISFSEHILFIIIILFCHTEASARFSSQRSQMLFTGFWVPIEEEGNNLSHWKLFPIGGLWLRLNDYGGYFGQKL